MEVRPAADALPLQLRAAGAIPLTVLAVIAAVAALSLAEPLFIPLVAGTLLAFALAPVVKLLERCGVPRILAATAVMLTLISLTGAGVYSVWDDARGAISALPDAARKLRHTLHEERRRESSTFADVHQTAVELERAAAEASGTRAQPSASGPSLVTQLQAFVLDRTSRLLRVAAYLGVACLLALLLLCAGEDVQRKLMVAVGPSLARKRITLGIFGEVTGQIQRYMLVTAVINLLIGLTTAAFGWALGLGHAGMWGAAAGLLHFIPYAGAPLAAAAIGIAAFLQFDSVGAPIVLTVGTLAIAVALGTVLQTVLQGRASRMNAVAITVGLLFWGWLWGGWGLILGIPLLAVLKAAADRVAPRLGELLGPV